MCWWPPFLASGIRVRHIADDWSSASVALKLRSWNKNYFGTQFGGNLFKMCDPFWALLMTESIGRGHIVWDAAGEIDFVAPGRETVYAHFKLSAATLAEVREAAAGGDKVLRWFENDITTADGTVVARVRKQLYIREKRARSNAAA
tara:strand:+ start:247 stop:684 length:438 start_codon:yes stop_codon:yes gene_type:complete